MVDQSQAMENLSVALQLLENVEFPSERDAEVFLRFLKKMAMDGRAQTLYSWDHEGRRQNRITVVFPMFDMVRGELERLGSSSGGTDHPSTE